MDIKKLFSIGITLICSLSANVYAGPLANDICSKIPGHWYGIYTVKDQNVCKNYNGCTHILMTDVSSVANSNNEYHVYLNPAVGEGGEFNIKCENGVISSPIPNSKASVSCNTMNHCFVVYDDPRLTSEMMKD